MSKSNSLLALSKIEKSLNDAACPDWLIWSPMADGPLFILNPALLTPKCSLHRVIKLRDVFSIVRGMAARTLKLVNDR